ncbi:hypothetical protein Tco_0740977 [Tanacetum coccineum]
MSLKLADRHARSSRILIILGRPFMATARAMIDVFNKKVTLKVGDDEVIFDMEQSMKKPSTEDDECYSIDCNTPKITTQRNTTWGAAS